jgi:hypothetical protein
MGESDSMSLTEVLAIVFVAAVLLTVPVGVIWGIVDYVKKSPRRRERGGGSAGGSGLGPVLMDLDRLTRPSVEHVVEAQNRVIRCEDDACGDDPPGRLPPV